MLHYLKDKPLAEKRWQPSRFKWITRVGYRLPRRSDVQSKEVDPRWRENWDRFAVLYNQDFFGPYHVFISDQFKVKRTWLAVTTNCVAMRVGPDPVYVMFKDETDRETKPVQLNDHPIWSQSQVAILEKNYQVSVTYI